MAPVPPNRSRVTGLNESMILIALEDILASIQPSKAPRLTTAGSAVNYTSAVRQVRRAKVVGTSVAADEVPLVTVRRSSTTVENFPANRLRATMTVELGLHVMGSDAWAADAALHALEDDIIAAVYSGFRMTPGYPDGDGPEPYAHDVNLVTVEDMQVDESEHQAHSIMTWEIVYSRDTGKEAGHTGYIP